MTIRAASPADSTAIAQLTLELGYPAEAHAIQSRLEKILGCADHLVLVAVANEKVVGWLQAHSSLILESGLRVEIVGLVVSKNHRRGGIGRSLVRRAEEWAIATGAENVTVRSNTQRTESHSFYPALGFTLTKTQAVYRKLLEK